ncbi:cell division protein ZapE [Arenimonas sp.]|uniref:cell division protein ZapE n=1 Tax=Arenimonas sp. TaxID=1872635 RepID=UPI0039C8795C
MTPSQAYAAGAAAGHWRSDPAQLAALVELDRIQRELAETLAEGAWGKFAARFRAPVVVQGLYLWGSVGRGKTFLADLLFDAATVPKRRWHFHRFMGEVHARLRALPDTADTLAVVARELAADLRLLVLDEFFVGDIGDAMILGRLLDQLIMRGVTLVTTSNTVPSELYRDGLQRASFLPCIALIERNCHVVKLESAQDYRLRHLQQAATYHAPLGADSEAALTAQFERLAAHSAREAGPLRINDRAIAVKAMADGLVWFDFRELCEGPRSAADYIEIARGFHTVFVSGVPRFDGSNEDAARRFVYFIDEIYDRHVNLLLSAAADPLSLYQGHRLDREFERTSSRLIEMQSADYLALEHRP